MKEKHWFYFGLELLLAAVYLFMTYPSVDVVQLIVCGLVLACLLAAKLLAQLLKAPVAVVVAASVGTLATLFVVNPAVLLPLFITLLVEVLGQFVSLQQSVILTIVASVLAALMFTQTPLALLLALLAAVAAVWGTGVLQQLGAARTALGDKDGRIAVLQSQLANQRDTIAAIEQQGRQAERNRLAARIHDQIGHGVTGSVLMLEAALILLGRQPEQARANIEQATENLRSSVDGIRAELREERVVHDEASLAKISEQLERFEGEHSGVQTELVVDGALDEVSQTIWVCIYEALRETLTNVLKHSNATKFKVIITLRNRLVYVEFSDNGRLGVEMDNTNGHVGFEMDKISRRGDHWSPAEPTASWAVNDRPYVGMLLPGIGLQSIEERCFLCGGKSFFSQTPQGFITKMTFALKDSQ
jgi:signal transduction histidine kinase